MDNAIDTRAIKNFYIRYNLYTEGISFFIVVPVILFYAWAIIQLTQEQLVIFNKIWPPAFIFGIIFVLVNNWIVLIPILKYFKKLMKGETVSDGEYLRAKRRFLRLPAIHAIGAFFRWNILLYWPIVLIVKYCDVTRPQAVNMWLAPPLCAILGIGMYFSITEILVQNTLNRGIFAKKIEADFSPRISLLNRLTAMSVSSVLLPVFLLFMFVYITVETSGIATSMLYLRVGLIITGSIVIGLFSPLLVNRTIRDKMKAVEDFLGRIGSGNLNAVPREVAVHDEVRDVIDDVDDMRGRLLTAREELVDLNLNLEAKVQERTEELEAAMNELEAMNENLIEANRALERTEKARKKDMQLAGSVQTSFLPKNPPVNALCDIACEYRPLTEVSGDFFDFYEIDGELRGVGLFDVSGHGISSGLLTLLAKSIITRTFTLLRDEKLSVIMEHINRELITEIGMIDNYISGIMLRFVDDRVEYVNCAHPDVIFRSASGKVGMVLEKPGNSYRALFLGVEDMNNTFPSLTIKWKPGDSLFMVTDCMIETKNGSGRVFGETGIMESLKRAPDGTAREVLNQVMNDFRDFHRDSTLNDDLTAIVIKKK